MSPRLQFAIETAYSAGKSTLALFDTGHDVEFKRDSSPVTLADKEAERIARMCIERRYPEEGILGEEEGSSGSSQTRWVLDPIDGTKSFICGVPLYATLIGFERDGQTLLGACYFPALDHMYYAERGYGSYLNGRQCYVSRRADLARATLCCGSHTSMEKHGRAEGFLDLAHKVLTTRTWGDAYGHALVASGRVEAMVDPVVCRWDVSAMQVIIEEAGGTMTTFSGASNPQDEAISTNGLLHSQVLDSFKR